MADQTERSFQKQPTVFLNRKKGIGVKRSRKPLRYHKDTEKAFQKQATVFLNRKGGMKKKDMRHHKNVGLGFKTPREVWFVFQDGFNGGGFVAMEQPEQLTRLIRI